MKKKFPEVKTAFTLAETLLTLAIVGVIAALTIPTLKDYSDEVRYITGVQKAFATINAATTAIETKHGDAMFWKFDQDKTINWYRETMNVIPTTNEQTTKIKRAIGECTQWVMYYMIKMETGLVLLM